MVAEIDSGLVRELRSRLLQVAVPAGLATGVLYLYGWAFSREFYRQMGVDTEVLDYSTTDYVLRSLDSFIAPIPWFVAWLFGLLAMAAAILVLMLQVVPWLLRRKNVREERIGRVLTVTGTVAVIGCLAGAALLDIANRLRDGQVTLVLVTAAAALGHGVVRVCEVGWPKLRAHAAVAALARLGGGLLSLLIVWAMFDATFSFATQTGAEAAALVANESFRRPEVVVYSEKPLGIEQSGAMPSVVDPTALPAEVPIAGAEPGDELRSADAAAPMIYRYSGLLMITEAGGKYVLWPCEHMLLTHGAVVIDSTQEGIWLDTRPVRNAGTDGYVPCSAPFDPLADFHADGDLDGYTRYLDALDREYARRPTTDKSVELARLVGVQNRSERESDDVIERLREIRCSPSKWARIALPVRELVDAAMPAADCADSERTS